MQTHRPRRQYRPACELPEHDLVVFAYDAPVYVQVKSSETPASKDHVTISGAPWTEAELYDGGPIFNKHDGCKAGLIMILDRVSADQTDAGGET